MSVDLFSGKSSERLDITVSPPFPCAPMPDSIGGINVRPVLDSWQVTIRGGSGRETRVMVHCCGASYQEVTINAFDALPDDHREDIDNANYEVDTILVQGAARLWDIVPADQSDDSPMSEPRLLARVVATNEDDAIHLAKARLRLSEDEFRAVQA